MDQMLKKMKLNLIRKPLEKPTLSRIMIAVLLLLGLVPALVIGTLGLFVAWFFSIFHPLILVMMTLVVVLCACSALVQALILYDIAIGRPGLSWIRLVGSLVFICIGWSVGYFLIEDSAGSYFYSPLSAWALIAIRCSVIFPVLVPLTSVVLRYRQVLTLIAYFLCFPVLWWWGCVAFAPTVESITHTEARQMKRYKAEYRSEREHNRICVAKVRAIRELDPVADAGGIFKQHGEVYMSYSYEPEYDRIAGKPEGGLSRSEKEHRDKVMEHKDDVVKTFPDCLKAPPLQSGLYTWSIRKRYLDECRAYKAAFNAEMVRLTTEERSREWSGDKPSE